MGINHRKIVSFEYTKKLVIKYFLLKEEDLTLYSENYNFWIEFHYNNYKIFILVQEDRDRVYYVYNTIKLIDNDYHYDETDFCALNAYYDDKDINLMPTKRNMHYQIKMTKKYLDENKIFYCFHTNDFKKRYFYIDNKIIDMPKIYGGDEIKYRFGDQAERMEKRRSKEKIKGIFINEFSNY